MQIPGQGVFKQEAQYHEEVHYPRLALNPAKAEWFNDLGHVQCISTFILLQDVFVLRVVVRGWPRVLHLERQDGLARCNEAVVQDFLRQAPGGVHLGRGFDGAIVAEAEKHGWRAIGRTPPVSASVMWGTVSSSFQSIHFAKGVAPQAVPHLFFK